AEGGAAVRDRLREFALGLGLSEDHQSLLETLLAVETEASRDRVAGLEGDALVHRIADAVIATLRSAATGGPRVLVFDDLHWSDLATLELIAQVATVTPDEPILLLCLLRPDRNAPSWPLLDRLRSGVGSAYVRLDLEPLDRARSRELLDNLLQIDELPEGIRSTILQRSEGNPFFLEEVLRSLIDSGHLLRENGRWRATTDIGDVRIPETLAGVLAARIDRLPEPTKRVAQTASVLGRIFGYRPLASVCRSAPPEERIENVDPHLGTLAYEELVRERAREPEREFIFKHGLTQEAAYSLLLKARRRELHGRAGRVLEELYAERLEEVAPLLARHFSLGGDAERAARYAVQAAQRAVALYALAEAEVHYETAVEALESLEDAPKDRLLDVILGWAVVRYKLKRYDGVLDRLHAAEALARSEDDRPRLARILSWISLMYMITGFPSRSGPYMRESAELASELGMDQLLLLPFFFATETLIDRDPRRAALQFEEVITTAREYGMKEIEGHALASSAVAYARLGDFGRARTRIREALAAAPSGGHPVKEADVHMILAQAHYELGEIETGLEHARRGAELAASRNAFECACAGYYAVGMGELERHELDRAVRSFDQSLEWSDMADWSGWTGIRNRIRAGTAAVRVAKGTGEAVADLEQALANARSGHDEYGVATLSERIARAHLTAGDPDRSATHLAEALEFYRRSGMKPYEAR
nr:hypothetical protein [Gemmatimonadota bacterium]NIU77403.1 hypothetical protein [Gammaproteobacteria bacterium]